MIKSRLLPLIFLAVGLLVSLAMVEVAFRLMPAAPKRRITDRPLRYYRAYSSPNMRGNPPSEGRGTGPVSDGEREYHPRQGTDRFRIAVVGDSFTFGPKLQAYDTFPRRLEWLLNLPKDKPAYEVISFGTPGASTHHEVALVQRALRSGADLVILQITLNDAQERPLRAEPAEFSGKGPPSGIERVVSSIFGWSRVYQFVRTRIYNYLSVGRYINYHHALFSEPRTWNAFQESLDKMRDDARTHHKPVVAVLFPLFDFPINDHYPFLDLHQKIAAACAARQIPFLDLRESYAGLEPSRIQLIPGADSHPNEIGHRIAAEKIFPWLIHSKLIPMTAAEVKIYNHRDNVNESVSAKNPIYPRKKSR